MRNPHVLTIAASFWPRRFEEWRFPVEARLFHSGPDVQVLVHCQRPKTEPKAEVVLIHGLEGSSQSGYMQSLAQTLLEDGCAVHRFNMRTCGGTEFLCTGLYHAGLTSDVLAWLLDLDRQRRTPVYLVGFSLGGNVALKLAGELGEDGRRLLAGVCAVSTPLDLAACARAIGEPRNWIYQRNFLWCMKRRLRLRLRVLDPSIQTAGFEKIPTLWDFDDRITARGNGFRGADHYYSTQSAIGFLHQIRVPTLLVQAVDDPMIPFSVFQRPEVRANPFIRIEQVNHGGHLGFLARGSPRIWIDSVVRDWVIGNK